MVPPPLRQASRGHIRDALVIVFDKNPNDPPNMNKMCPIAKEKLGLRASNRQIQDVGDGPELKARRGPVGQKNAEQCFSAFWRRQIQAQRQNPPLVRSCGPRARLGHGSEGDVWLPSGTLHDFSSRIDGPLFGYPHQCSRLRGKPAHRPRAIGACDLHHKSRYSIQNDLVLAHTSMWHNMRCIARISR